MKRKIKAAKKGMVLVLTSVILFVATSIVAVLSTFVIITRNQKIEYEYISRTKIALKNKSFELYSKVLISDFIAYGASITTSDHLEKPHTISNFDPETYGFKSGVSITYTCYRDIYDIVEDDDYDGDDRYYYEYQFDASMLTNFESEGFREIGIITTVYFVKGHDLTNPNSYSIGEMRFY